MATIKQRLHRKNASNTYDTIHLETSADLLVGAVPITKGGTGATTAAAARAALQALYDDFPSRTSYTNVDFNTITTNGVYRMLYNDGTDQTPYHTPYAQYTSGYKTVTHYNLLVMGMPTRLTQIAISAYSHNDDAVFVRNKHDSTWSSWRRFYTDAQRIPITNGGTGLNTNPSLLVNLASGSAAGVFAASPRPGVTGTLPVARGGTGVTSLDALKTALGIGGGSSGGGMIASKVVIGTYSGTYDGSTNASQTITVGDVTELLAVLVVSREGAMYYLGKSSDGFFNGGLAVKGYSVTGRLGTVVSISGNTFTVYSDSGSYGRRGANSSGIHQYIAFGT